MFFIFALLCLAVLLRFLLIGRAKYGTIENSGFPIMPTTLFLGSVPGFYKYVQHDEDVARAKKYGPIWGLYEGREPQVFICDPDLVKQICVKDFHYFHSGRLINLGPVASEILNLLQGETWKFMRSRLSPVFTSSKLKWYAGSIDEYFKEVTADLSEMCLNKHRLKLDCGKNTSSWFINAFTRVTFGMEVADYKNPNNAFISAFREMMGENICYNFGHSLVLSFPFLERYISPFLDETPQNLINTMLRQILENRRGVQRNNDLADVLNDLWDKIGSPELENLRITENTLIGQALAFLVGGYDSSHLTVCHLMYFLANDPAIQNKLFEEIKRVFPDGKTSKITHESIQSSCLPYLEACFNEALRIGPSFFRPERICNRDWNYKGYKIKAGTTVMVATWGLHFNADQFPDPNSFIPERFLAGNAARFGPINPYAFAPFGHGPRACIGMRIAYEVMKLFMVNLLLSFRIETRADSKLEYKTGCTILAHFKGPVYVDLVLRE